MININIHIYIFSVKLNFPIYKYTYAIIYYIYVYVYIYMRYTHIYIYTVSNMLIFAGASNRWPYSWKCTTCRRWSKLNSGHTRNIKKRILRIWAGTSSINGLQKHEY
jgi:hypothetical protein